MKTITHKYVDFSGIVSNTIPGRCYSIGELLQRVMRGQPLPQVGAYEEDRGPDDDENVEKRMQIDMLNPSFEPDMDIIEAKDAVELLSS